MRRYLKYCATALADPNGYTKMTRWAGEKSCSTDVWRTAVYETRTYGGVRGALAVIWPSAVYSIRAPEFQSSPMIESRTKVSNR
ncbi:MAG: hypothetical protein GY845_22315 [Planctomycetes bacterium]|nr:hypothetical protein [Planctomycetota bacterium]